MFAERIDLVLLDVRMPRLNGPRLVEAIRKAMPEARPPVVLLSGIPVEELRILADGCGADDWIPKPLTTDAFRSILRNFFSGET